MKQRLLIWSITVLTILGFASCSDNAKMTELLERVPDDTDVVAVGNVKTIIQSAGGSIEDGKIKLPQNILDEMPSKAVDGFDDFNAFLKDSGIDPDACAVVGSYEDPMPTVIFALTDEKKFIKAIEDEGFEEESDEDGMVMYTKKVYDSPYDESYDDYGYIAVKDSYAYWIERVWSGSDFKPVKAIKKLIRGAEEAPFAGTAFCDYITSDNAGGAAFRIPRKLRHTLRDAHVSDSERFEGVICLKAKLESDAATIDMKWFGEDGKAKSIEDFKDFIKPDSRIDTGALRYLGKNESMVYALSLKDFDWDKYIDLTADAAGMSSRDRSELSEIRKYISNIDGTVAVGMGFDNGLESLLRLSAAYGQVAQFDFTVVAGVKKGKADDMMKKMKKLMEQGGPDYESTAKGFHIKDPKGRMEIYAEVDGDYVIVSNHKIVKSDDNPTAKAFSFGDYMAAAVLYLGKDNKLMRDLGIDSDFRLSLAVLPDDVGATLTLEAKGGKSDGIIAKITDIILDIAHQKKSIGEKRSKYTNGTDSREPDYYGDTAVVEEEVVVEEVVAE